MLTLIPNMQTPTQDMLAQVVRCESVAWALHAVHAAINTSMCTYIDPNTQTAHQHVSAKRVCVSVMPCPNRSSQSSKNPHVPLVFHNG